MVFVPNSSFTYMDRYFKMAIVEAFEAFNKTLVHFGYTQKLETYDPKVLLNGFSSHYNYTYFTLHVHPRLFLHPTMMMM